MFTIKYYVYWLHDATCSIPEISGYVGITCDLQGRIRKHKRSKKFPLNFSYVVLFEGSRIECLKKENEYRPLPDVGWNISAGGHGGHLHSKKTKVKIGEKILGLKRSDETKMKISLSHTEDRKKKASDRAIGNQYGKFERSIETKKKMSEYSCNMADEHKKKFKCLCNRKKTF